MPGLRTRGIPRPVAANRLRFRVLLDHAFDQWGWAKTPHAFFATQTPTSEQVAGPAALNVGHFDGRLDVRIGSRLKGDRSESRPASPRGGWGAGPGTIQCKRHDPAPSVKRVQGRGWVGARR